MIAATGSLIHPGPRVKSVVKAIACSVRRIPDATHQFFWRIERLKEVAAKAIIAIPDQRHADCSKGEISPREPNTAAQKPMKNPAIETRITLALIALFIFERSQSADAEWSKRGTSARNEVV